MAHQLAPAWSFLAYDHYVLAPGADQKVFTDGRLSLAEFKKLHCMLITANKSFMSPEGLPVLPGEKELAMPFTFASEPAKKASQSLIKKIMKAAQQHVCIGPITADNLRFSKTGGVKLKNVVVMENLDEADLEDGLKRNFVDAADRIDLDIFDGNPPEEIQHLTNLMRTEFNVRNMFPIHAGLVPITNYPGLSKELHDFIRFKIPKAVLRTILLALPGVADWKTTVRTSQLLEITLNHGHGGQYRVPYNRPDQTFLRPEQQAALIELGLYEYAHHHPQVLTPDQLAMLNALRLLDFLRNRPAHRMEPSTNFHWILWNQDFTAKSSELVTRVRFPLVLCVVQYILQVTNNLLSQLDLEAFF